MVDGREASAHQLLGESPRLGSGEGNTFHGTESASFPPLISALVSSVFRGASPSGAGGEEGIWWPSPEGAQPSPGAQLPPRTHMVPADTRPGESARRRGRPRPRTWRAPRHLALWAKRVLLSPSPLSEQQGGQDGDCGISPSRALSMGRPHSHPDTGREDRAYGQACPGAVRARPDPSLRAVTGPRLQLEARQAREAGTPGPAPAAGADGPPRTGAPGPTASPGQEGAPGCALTRESATSARKQVSRD